MHLSSDDYRLMAIIFGWSSTFPMSTELQIYMHQAKVIINCIGQIRMKGSWFFFRDDEAFEK